MDHVILACHTTWQELAHIEVIEMCGHGDHPFGANMFNKLKMVLSISFV
jgi:hypothetical protein